MDKTHAALQRRPAKDPGPIERRIGRWLGRFPAAERLLEVTVERDAGGPACGLQSSSEADRAAWAAQAHGAYLLRTNCPEKDPAKLWRWYMQLTQAEDAFRISKSDLSLRPVFHQKTERVEAHILVCFPEPGAVAHAGNVDARQRPGQLCAAVAQGSSRPCAAWTWSCRSKKPKPADPRRCACASSLALIGRWPNCWSAWVGPAQARRKSCKM